MPSTSLWNGQQSCRSLLSRKRCTLIRRLNNELINVCGQSLKLFFAGLKNCLIAKFAPEGFYRLVYMLRCSKADFEGVDFFVWKPYYTCMPRSLQLVKECSTCCRSNSKNKSAAALLPHGALDFSCASWLLLHPS